MTTVYYQRDVNLIPEGFYFVCTHAWIQSEEGIPGAGVSTMYHSRVVADFTWYASQ